VLSISEAGAFYYRIHQVIMIILGTLEVSDGPKGLIKEQFLERIQLLREKVQPTTTPLLPPFDILEETRPTLSREDWQKLLDGLNEVVQNPPFRPINPLLDPRPFQERFGVDRDPEKFDKWLDEIKKEAFDEKAWILPDGIKLDGPEEEFGRRFDEQISAQPGEIEERFDRSTLVSTGPRVSRQSGL
jgi:hypothetical protein